MKTPPFGPSARIEAGFLLRRLQRGESLSMPQSRPMPTIGLACHELRVADERTDWRIIYHVAAEAIVILDVLPKKTTTTPKHVLTDCKTRLAEYQRVTSPKKGRPDAHRHSQKA